MIDVRIMTQDDLRQVLTWAPREIPWRPVTDFMKHTFLVAVREGQAVGIGGMSDGLWAANAYGLLMAATHPDHRGHGIHRLLIQARITAIHDLCSEPLIFTSSRRPERYEPFGFKVLHTRSDGLSQLLRSR